MLFKEIVEEQLSLDLNQNYVHFSFNVFISAFKMESTIYARSATYVNKNKNLNRETDLTK